MPDSRRTAALAPILGADFQPPHCPNRDCDHYTPSPDWRWKKNGSFSRPHEPARFQCFRCSRCRRHFSVRTFAADYWLRHRRLFPQVVGWSVEGPGFRQTGRQFQISHATVARHIARAGRLSLLFHRQLIQNRPAEDTLSVDGFETFEFSQFFPFHLNLGAGTKSWFIWGFTSSPLRRKGRMTAAQRRRRAELEARLGRPDPKSVERGVDELLRQVWGAARTPGETRAYLLHTDDHPAYRRALSQYRRETGRAVTHEITPGTAPRTILNPLFAVNLADLLLRHGQANHRRETIAFSKRLQGAIERAAVFMVWRNYVKWRREKAPGETAAMAAGVCGRRMGWKEILRRRRFPREEFLPGSWTAYYWRRIRTAALGDGQQGHQLKYAF